MTLRRRAWLTSALAAAALAPVAAWALRPLLPTAQPSTVLDALPVSATAARAPDRLVAQVDPNVFTARLWNPRPPPPPSEALWRAETTTAPTPPPRPDLALVAVIEQEGRLRAALYDPAELRVRVLDVGATIRQYTVVGLTSAGVNLTEGQWTHELRLREDRPPSPLSKLIDATMPQARAVP